ncbi:hypothetical protein QOZ80_5BG0409900 [Eleusine coracana subsp. coracana]|nr:hypothetical protein QOZ80_5BG0409900 [Eleusine coracana subsp. coracana]
MSESNEERPSCSCRQSKCVQRYCSCFRAFYYCSENCQCIGCRNTERREAYVEERVQMILKKNPNAFDPKVAIVQEVAQSPAVEEAKQVFVQSYSAAAVLGDKELSDVKGCSCQAIKCSDMNCECFKFMVGCSEICKCEECANSFGIKGSGCGITSEAIKVEIKMEEGTQSEQALSSYPNKRPRITGDLSIKSEQHDTGGITNEAINMENPTQSEDASSSDSNKHL